MELAIKKDRGDELSRMFELKILEKQGFLCELPSDSNNIQNAPLHLIDEVSLPVFDELEGQYDAKTIGENSSEL